MFADALIEQAKAGVRVRVIYDWVGGFNNTSRAFWRRLRESGVDVRCYNPPHFDSPIGWLSRDHRKVIVVDRTVAFVTGLCIGQAWVGDPARNRDPWRDTGVEICGPAIADVEEAFADSWAATGDPLPAEGYRGQSSPRLSTRVSRSASSPPCPARRDCFASISSSPASRAGRCG